MLACIIAEMEAMLKDTKLIVGLVLGFSLLFFVCSVIQFILVDYASFCINNYGITSLTIICYIVIPKIVTQKVVRELHDGILITKLTREAHKIKVLLADNICDAFVCTIICGMLGMAGLYIVSNGNYDHLVTVLSLVPVITAMTRCHILALVRKRHLNGYVPTAIAFLSVLPFLILTLAYINKYDTNPIVLYLLALFCVLTYTFISVVLIEYIDVTS